MSKKLTLKNVVITISISIVVLILILLLILGIASKKPIAAFYGLSSANQKNIEAVLQTTHTRRNKNSLPYNIVILDDSLSLKNALKKVKKPDLLFIHNGLNADYAISLIKNNKQTFDPSILNGMTTSIKLITPTNKKRITAVPLLIDNYELDVNTEAFNKSKVNKINTISDLESFALNSDTQSPLIFAANDDDTLINVFGALTEALAGKDAFYKASEKIQENIKIGKSSSTAFYELLKDLCANGEPFYETYTLLTKWMEDGVVPKNLYQMTKRDINVLLEGSIPAATFMTFSDHRTIKRETISKYSSSFIVSNSENDQRNFSAPIICAIQLKNNKIAHNSIQKLAGSLQSSLSIKAGLAPVLANCNVADHQADDVRYWVAASGTPIPSFTDATFTNKPNKKAFADALRSILR